MKNEHMLSLIREARTEAYGKGCSHAGIEIAGKFIYDVTNVTRDAWEIQMDCNGIFWFRVDLNCDLVASAFRLHCELHKMEWRRRLG